MTDLKISQLNTITGANVSDANDLLPIVDISGNETKAITRAELFKSVGEITVTGNVEVDGTIHSTSSADGLIIFGGSNNDGAHLELYGSATGSPNLAIIDADNIRFRSQAASEWARFVSGNFGIGLTSPSYKLDVNGVIQSRAGMVARTSFLVGSETAAGSILYVNDSTSRIGVNTASPERSLHVTGGVKISRTALTDFESFIRLEGNGTDYWDIGLDKDDTNAFYLWDIVNARYPFAVYPGTDEALLTLNGSTASVGGTLSVSSTATIGTSSSSDAPLVLSSTDARCGISLNDNTTTDNFTVTVSAVGDEMKLRGGGNDTATVTNTAFRVDGDFNVDSGTLWVGSTLNRVGIGTIAPDFPLDVDGIIKGRLSIIADSTGSVFDSFFRLSDNGTGKWDIAGDFSTNPVTGSGTGAFYIWDNVNSKYPFGIYPNTDSELLKLDGGLVSVGGDFEVNGKTIMGRGSTLTIASGAITVTHSYHLVDTEAAAASDNLDTINGGEDGQMLYLQANSSARTVTLTESGNINLLTTTYDLDNTADTVTLIYRSGISKWCEVGRSNNAT